MRSIGFATLLLIFQCTTTEKISVYVCIPISKFKIGPSQANVVNFRTKGYYKGDGPVCTATLPNSSVCLHPH